MIIDDLDRVPESSTDEVLHAIKIDCSGLDAKLVCDLFPTQKASLCCCAVSDGKQHSDAVGLYIIDVSGSGRRTKVQERQYRLCASAVFVLPIVYC